MSFSNATNLKMPALCFSVHEKHSENGFFGIDDVTRIL